MDYKLLGKNIAKIRKANHMTQEQLAEKAEVSTVFISQIETAARKPSLETIYKISVVLNTTIDILLGNQSVSAQLGELEKILDKRTHTEVDFVIGVVREMCSHIENEKILPHDTPTS